MAVVLLLKKRRCRCALSWSLPLPLHCCCPPTTGAFAAVRAGRKWRACAPARIRSETRERRRRRCEHPSSSFDIASRFPVTYHCTICCSGHGGGRCEGSSQRERGTAASLSSRHLDGQRKTKILLHMRSVRELGLARDRERGREERQLV